MKDMAFEKLLMESSHYRPEMTFWVWLAHAEVWVEAQWACESLDDFEEFCRVTHTPRHCVQPHEPSDLREPPRHYDGFHPDVRNLFVTN